MEGYMTQFMDKVKPVGEKPNKSKKKRKFWYNFIKNDMLNGDEDVVLWLAQAIAGVRSYEYDIALTLTHTIISYKNRNEGN